MDAITLIKKDHREFERLFKEFQKTTDRATTRRRTLADKIILEMVRHSVVEEEFMYPAIRERNPKEAGHVLEALEEHHVVKWLLLELHRLDAHDERFAPKMKVLIDVTRHHIEEEEEIMFKLLRSSFDKAELNDLGLLLEEGKKTAPTRPHPRAPDTPPQNLVAGAVAAMMDRARDVLASAGERRAPRQLAAKAARAVKPKTNGARK